MVGNTILIVDGSIVCTNYATQTKAKELAQLEQQVNAEFDNFLSYKQEIIQGVTVNKNRVDNKFVKAYS